MHFDADTAVRQVETGTYAADLTDRYSIGPYPNGGYILAVALRALAAASPHPDPFTVTAHYLRPPAPGQVLIEVEQVRAGRAHSTAMVRMLQEDTERVRVLATMGDLDRIAGPDLVTGTAPRLPPPEACVHATRAAPGSEQVALLDEVELRMPADRIGWAMGQPGKAAEHVAWLRPAGGGDANVTFLALAVDALPPTVFAVGLTRSWVPTIELTVHMRGRPAPGWLRVAVQTRFLIGGYLEEDAEVWDATDRLVAQSRQLARMAPG